jgi:hypothetical protein
MCLLPSAKNFQMHICDFSNELKLCYLCAYPTRLYKFVISTLAEDECALTLHLQVMSLRFPFGWKLGIN